MTEWTDEELAKQLKRIAPVVIPRGPLLEAAADRLLALSAHVALLKAALAQAEHKAEKPAASAEQASELARSVAEIAQSHIGSQRPGADEPEEREYWDMCQRVIDAPAASAEPVAWAKENGAVAFDAFRASCWKSNADKVVALYSAPQPDRVAELTAEVERLRAALAASCEEEREQIYEAGSFAGGCARATEAEAEVERLRGLIAAAPDLLEALQRSLNWLASYPGGCAEGCYEQASAAIAKATGKEASHD